MPEQQMPEQQITEQQMPEQPLAQQNIELNITEKEPDYDEETDVIIVFI